jgi:Firmicute plasmid replication protein (RepL)
MTNRNPTENKTRRGLRLYDHNPFISSAVIETKTRRITNKKGDMMIVARETGEIIAPIAGFWQAEEVDSTKFVKLYVNGVKAFKELTGSGTKVFELLYLEIQKEISRDLIYLSFSTLDKNTRMSQATFTRGMRELMDKGFIAPAIGVGWYWLNPDYIWNGDRLAFVKEYRRKKIIENQDKLFRDSAQFQALIHDLASVSSVSDTATAQDQSSESRSISAPGTNA